MSATGEKEGMKSVIAKTVAVVVKGEEAVQVAENAEAVAEEEGDR